MALVFEHTLFAFAVVDMVIAISMIVWKDSTKKEKLCYAAFYLSCSVWMFFFGSILTQTDVNTAYRFRCFGMVGTIMSLTLALFCLAKWSPLRYRIKKILCIVCAAAGVLIYPWVNARAYLKFSPSKIGMSYEFQNNFWNFMYMLYYLIIVATYLIFVIPMLKKSSNKATRHMGKIGIVALIILMIGSVFDTIMPMLGFTAFPGSSLMLFPCSVVFFYGINYDSRNRIIMSNTAKHIFKSARIAILVYDTKEKLIMASDYAYDYLNLPRNFGSGDARMTELFGFESNPLEGLTAPIMLESTVRNSEHTCGLEINPFFDNYGDNIGYMVFVYDTTERKKFIADLEQARLNADQASAAKSMFLANMSHEIRTPINTVLGMNEMIKRESSEKQIHEYSNNIRRAGEALLAIINDVLDFAKVEAGKMEIVSEKYMIKDIITGLYGMFYYKCEEKGLRFYTKIDPDIPRSLIGDHVRIRQVMMNLLNNAVKYTERGSITFEVESKPVGNECKLIFSVADTGIGIRQEDKKRLFESFSRFESKKTRYIEGTGLGLSIVREFANLMNADVSVDSEYGIGSVFTFTLHQPIADAEPIGYVDLTMESEEEVQEPVTEAFIAPQASVLVVDDNQMNLQVIKGLLKKTKVQLDTVLSGRECIEAVKKHKYDIVFLDHMMPVMDGVETLSRVKAMSREDNLSCNAAFIALTANAVHGAREFYLANGFDSYLSKPVEWQILEETLRKYLPSELIVKVEADVQSPGYGSGSHSREGLGGYADVNESFTKGYEPAKLLAEYGIDLKAGLEFCIDTDIYRETAAAFCDMAPEAMSNLTAFRAAKDVENYRILIHSIKTNARTLGYSELFEYALSQENLCKENRFGEVEKDNNLPEQKIALMREALMKAFDICDNSSKENDEQAEYGEALANTELKSILEDIVESLDDFDDGKATETLEKLLATEMKEDLREKLKSAGKKISQFDYEGASQMVGEILEQL